jgi:hypothetical protein
VCIIDCYEDAFLHRHTVIDTQHLLAKSEEHVFPNMFGSIDCMHWQ